MTRLARLVSIAGAAVLIGACGGGGGGGMTALTPADPSDKFIGSWATCIAFVVNGIDLSALTVFTAAKIDATHGSFATTATPFANAGCAPPAAGAPVPVPELTGTVAIDSAASGPFGADRITITPSAAPSFKDIALVNGNQLQFGDELSPPDAQGYPSTLDTLAIFIRQ